jgi:hypothetical protein
MFASEPTRLPELISAFPTFFVGTGLRFATTAAKFFNRSFPY